MAASTKIGRVGEALRPKVIVMPRYANMRQNVRQRITYHLKPATKGRTKFRSSYMKLAKSNGKS